METAGAWMLQRRHDWRLGMAPTGEPELAAAGREGGEAGPRGGLCWAAEERWVEAGESWAARKEARPAACLASRAKRERERERSGVVSRLYDFFENTHIQTKTMQNKL